MKIGMNLTAPVYWSGDFPFNDLMKCAGDWAAQGGKAKPVVEVDEKGWPLAIPEGATRIYTMLPMTGEEQVIHVHYEGVMEFKFQAAMTVLEKRDGYVRLSTRSASGVSTQLLVTAIDPANPPKNIAVVPDARYEAWKRGEIFTAGFLANPLVRDVPVLRFMDWLRTNGATRTDMGPAEDVRSYFWGVPLTVCLKLAALVGAAPWINIPEHATDATILAMGSLCPPGTIFEWPNEVWNTGFPAGKNAMAAATAEGIDKGSLIGRRMGQVALVLESVGQRLAVGYQPTENAKGWDRWEAAFKATGAQAGWVMGTAYGTGKLNALKALQPFIDSGDQTGIIDALDNDVPVMGRRADNVVMIAKRINDHVPEDRRWEAVPVLYEFNPAHLNSSRSSDAAVEIVAKAQRDPRMKAVSRKLLDRLKAAGIKVACAFDLSSGPSRYGYFGAAGTPFGEVLLEEMAASKPSPVPAALTAEEKVDRLWADYLARTAIAPARTG